MKVLKPRKVILIIGDLDDFESPAKVVFAWVTTTRQAESALTLAAAADKTDPISWSWDKL